MMRRINDDENEKMKNKQRKTDFEGTERQEEKRKGTSKTEEKR